MSSNNGKGKKGQNIVNMKKATEKDTKMVGTHLVPEAAVLQLQQAFQQANQAAINANNFAAGVLSGMTIDTQKYEPTFAQDYSSVTLKKREEPPKAEEPATTDEESEVTEPEPETADVNS